MTRSTKKAVSSFKKSTLSINRTRLTWFLAHHIWIRSTMVQVSITESHLCKIAWLKVISLERVTLDVLEAMLKTSVIFKSSQKENLLLTKIAKVVQNVRSQTDWATPRTISIRCSDRVTLTRNKTSKVIKMAKIARNWHKKKVNTLSKTELSTVANGSAASDMAMENRPGQMVLAMKASGAIIKLTVKASSIMSMVTSLMANGVMTKPTDLEHTSTSMAPSMKANGSMIFKTVKEKKLGEMAQSMRACTTKGTNMARVATSGPTEVCMKATG